jgi:hypothetical protein
MRQLLARAFGSAAMALSLAVQFAAAQAAPPQAAGPLTRQALRGKLDALRTGADSSLIPAADQFTFGDRTVAASSSVAGPVTVALGTVHVRGTVNGDVFVYGGDLIVHEGGAVLGNALAVNGKVRLDGGRVTGDLRSLGGDLTAAPTAAATTAAPSAMTTTVGQLLLVVGWLGVMIIVGIGVLVLASSNLDASADVLERSFGRALLAGIAGQLALLPALAVLIVGLALTLLGILLIPFAIVAYVLAAAGLVTLGYLAVARVTGRSLQHDGAQSERARRESALKALIIGLVVMMLPWFAAGLLSWSPMAGLVARVVAIAVTWVAASAGLGAALLSRGGVNRMMAPAAQRAMTSASWATPTPVAGVVAARRQSPTSASK